MILRDNETITIKGVLIMPELPKILLLVETSRVAGRDILLGIASYSHIHGPWHFSRKPPFYILPEEKQTSQLKNTDIDGIITAGGEKMEEVLAMNLPTISIDVREQMPGIPNAFSDSFTIGKIGAAHLLERGFRNFAYCGFDNIHWSRERGESFEQNISQEGFETHLYKSPNPEEGHIWDKEQIHIADWLKTLPLPVGLMACNDDCAQHILQACKIAGLKTPYDVAILGVDNDKLICNLTNPPLSSISLNFQKAGYEIAKLLDRSMAGKETAQQSVIIQATHVVTRPSTDIMAIEDREVAQAIQYIRWNTKQNLSVNNVVEEVNMARRTLERHFQKTLGHSINKEITLTRIKQTAQLLIETNMSIAKIAATLGYPGYEHISRYFRKEMGMSPLEYRKKFGNK